MSFKGIKNVDDLVRKAEWEESVERIKEAIYTDNSDHLLNILEKELGRVRKKQKKYNYEVKKLRKMIEEVKSGVKVEDVNSLLNNEDIEDKREELQLREISTEEDYDQYNKDLENRQKLL